MKEWFGGKRGGGVGVVPDPDLPPPLLAKILNFQDRQDSGSSEQR